MGSNFGKQTHLHSDKQCNFRSHHKPLHFGQPFHHVSTHNFVPAISYVQYSCYSKSSPQVVKYCWGRHLSYSWKVVCQGLHLTLIRPLCVFTFLRPASPFFLIDATVRKSTMQSLDQAVATLRGRTFAKSTQRTYQSQQALYLQFCSSPSIAPSSHKPLQSRQVRCFLGMQAELFLSSTILECEADYALREGYRNP